MITAKDQETLFVNISRNLGKKVVCFAIGGTAMIFYGFKDITLDIDLVFLTEEDQQEFIRAANSLGYKPMGSVVVYGVKNNRPIMLTMGKERFDLFLRKVISFTLTEDIQGRAKYTHEFGENLVLKVIDCHDIILMKCATDRIKDREDAKKIIESRNIDWNILINEAEKQVIFGDKKAAVFELGSFLEELRDQMKIEVPNWVFEKLYLLLTKGTDKWTKE